jgi:hypothetical protein
MQVEDAIQALQMHFEKAEADLEFVYRKLEMEYSEKASRTVHKGFSFCHSLLKGHKSIASPSEVSLPSCQNNFHALTESKESRKSFLQLDPTVKP